MKSRLDPTGAALDYIYAKAKKEQKRVVFAEGETEAVLRAAVAFQNNGLGTPIVIADPVKLKQMLRDADIDEAYLSGLIIADKTNVDLTEKYIDRVYAKIQRKGYLRKDCERLLRSNPHVLGACMIAYGDADAMVTGMTANTQTVLERIRLVLDNLPNTQVMGVSLIVAKGKTTLISDTLVTEFPQTDDLVNIAKQSAMVARRLGIEPRVAMLSYSNFGYPDGEPAQRVRGAADILASQNVDFECDGEMSADIALNVNARQNYPFCKLSGNANVLVMPGIHSAMISASLLKQLGGATIIGPLLFGLEKSVQLIPMGSSVSDIVNMAAFAAYDLSS